MSEVNRLVYSVEVTEDKIHIIHLKDVFDPSTVEEFEHVLEYLFSNEHYKVVVNLARVEFVSSAGWGTCTSVLNQCRNHGGDIVLVGMQPEVFDVFMLLELDTFIEAFPDIDTGLKHFRAKSYVVNRANEIVETERVKEGKLENGAVTKERFQLPPDDEFENDEQDIFDESASSSFDAVEEDQDDEPDVSLEETQDFSMLATDDDIPVQRVKPVEPKSEREPVMPRKPPMDIHESPMTAPGSDDTLEREISRGKVARPEMPREPQPIHKQEPERKEDKKKFFDTEFYFGRPLTPLSNQKPNVPVQKNTAFTRSSGSTLSNRSSYASTPAPGMKRDPLLDRIMNVVVANPSLGPSAIRIELIKMGYADDSLTRSMIFKRLNDADLSTRNKRIEFAQNRRR